MKTIVKQGNVELYRIDKTHYLGNNGSLYVIPDFRMDEIYRQMIEKDEKDVLISLLPKADKIFKRIR